jgi:hypothetical protein
MGKAHQRKDRDNRTCRTLLFWLLVLFALENLRMYWRNLESFDEDLIVMLILPLGVFCFTSTTDPSIFWL